jgi:hypothetical protein
MPDQASLEVTSNSLPGVVSGAQDQKRSNDALATAAAVVVFWPAAFLLAETGKRLPNSAN